jgi:hypothetical protein
LDYDSAKVDLPLNTWRWYGLSAPLHNIYSGDFAFPWSTPMVDMQLHDITNPDSDQPATPDISRWTNHFNTSDVATESGMGFALRVANKYYQYPADFDGATGNKADDLENENVKVDYFNATPTSLADTTYYFPNILSPASRASNDTIYKQFDLYDKHLINASFGTVSKKYRHRFIFEDISGGGSRTRNGIISQAIGVSPLNAPSDVMPFGIRWAAADKRTVVVGNPFMSHLDITQFFSKNRLPIEKIYQSFKMINDEDPIEITYISTTTIPGTDDNTTYISNTGKISNNYLIPPMQAIIVQIASGYNRSGDNLDLEITPEMSVTDIGSTRKLLRTSAEEELAPNTLSITATRNERTTSAAFVIRDQAHDEYVEGEDSRLMVFETNTNTPSVYTAADDQLLDINVVQSIPALIPIGIIDKGEGHTEIRIYGVNSITNGAGANEQFYFVDLADNSRNLLKEGFTYRFYNDIGNQINRFFIQRRTNTGVAEAEKDKITIYSNRGHVFIASSDGKAIRRAEIYGVNGQLLWRLDSDNRTFIDVTPSLPSSGYYIVRASTESDSAVKKVLIDK